MRDTLLSFHLGSVVYIRKRVEIIADDEDEMYVPLRIFSSHPESTLRPM